MAFIDYEKVFDSVQTSAVMKTLRKQMVEKIYIKILEDIYKEITVTIKLHKVSEKVLKQKGVRQDNTISPKLLMAVLEKLLRTWNRMRQEFKSMKSI